MSENCLFCQIVNKTIPATVRYEDENWLAFDDIHKTAPEHVLIIPKTHHKTLEEVAMNDLELHSQLLLIARKIAKLIGVNENYKLFMNVGEKVQMIHHLHLHLLGGWDEKTPTKAMDDQTNQLIHS